MSKREDIERTFRHPYNSFSSERGDLSASARSPLSIDRPFISARDLNTRDRPGLQNSVEGLPSTKLPEHFVEHQNEVDGTFAQYLKPKFARAPITEAGRVAYLGESSNLTLLVQDRHGTSDVVHYPLAGTDRPNHNKHGALDELEVRILNDRGAFLLPPKELCDELVDDFFKWIAPIVPVINRNRFMRQYNDANDPPSILLTQAILLAGTRVCSNPQLQDADGSTTAVALTFYKRCKALYDSNIEDDRVTVVQALILMAWWWDTNSEHIKNVFYWTRVAITVAHGSGMHRRRVELWD